MLPRKNSQPCILCDDRIRRAPLSVEQAPSRQRNRRGPIRLASCRVHRWLARKCGLYPARSHTLRLPRRRRGTKTFWLCSRYSAATDIISGPPRHRATRTTAHGGECRWSLQQGNRTMSRIAATHATEKLQLSNTPGLTLTPAHTRNVITLDSGKPLESFAWLCSNSSDIATSEFRGIVEVTRKKYASPHLVYLRRLPRGLRRQGAHAYASIDHVDGRARYCRLDYRRRRDSSVLSAWCRRQISSRGINCIHHWGDSGFVRLAQVQTATATRITSLIWN